MENYEAIGNNMIKHAIDMHKLRPIGIQYTVELYIKSRDLMFEIVSHSLDAESQQSLQQMKTINNKLSSIYNISNNVNRIIIDYEQLYISTWGRIFWNFLHATSILIQQAYYENQLSDILEFNTFVKNIDSVLPCPVCTSHYLKIKNDNSLSEVFKLLDFGLLVPGVFKFHSEITKNIAIHANHSFKEFNSFHFVFQYGCYPRSKPPNFIERGIIQMPVKFYRPEHVKLAIIVMMAYNINYFHASNIINIICESIINKHMLTETFDTKGCMVKKTTTTRDQIDATNNASDVQMMNESPLTVIKMLGYCQIHLKPS